MKREAATDDELVWFDCLAYSPPKLSALSLKQWAVIICDRLVLKAALERGAYSDVLLDFERRLSVDPTCAGLNFHGAWSPQHKTDTPAVSLMDYFELSALHGSNIGRVPEDPTEPIALRDDRFVPGFGHDAMCVPVLVNFAATKAQVIKDFGEWLSRMHEFVPPATNRNYRTTTLEWSENHYLPYFDLHLFSAASRRSVSQAKIVELLGLGLPNEKTALGDRLKAPMRSLKVFTWDTLNAINMQLAHGGQDALGPDGEAPA